MARCGSWTVPMVLLLLPAAVTAKEKEVKVEGYAEWRSGECLIVDGQRVCPGADMEFKGKEAAVDYASVPLGYEVKARGIRRGDGAVVARKLEAKPNGMAMFETEIIRGTNAAEAEYRRVGHMFQQVAENQAIDLGVLLESGPMVSRVEGITRRLLPPYVDGDEVRVYVVDNPEWNAMAMGNYSIYVFSGLLNDLDDDEVAIVLGHEIAHASHEHGRRQFKKQMWIQLAALGLGLVNEQVNNDDANAIIALVGQFGALAWQNGYGRQQEDQADRVGLRYAYEGGYDITKGPKLWRRFARKYGEEDAVTNFFFSDHSQSSRRAEHLEQELALNYPDGPRRPARVEVAHSPSPPPREVGKKEITPGMSPQEVRALLGDPGDTLVFGPRSRWVYEDLTVIFEGEQVTDVRF